MNIIEVHMCHNNTVLIFVICLRLQVDHHIARVLGHRHGDPIVSWRMKSFCHQRVYIEHELSAISQQLLIQREWVPTIQYRVAVRHPWTVWWLSEHRQAPWQDDTGYCIPGYTRWPLMTFLNSGIHSSGMSDEVSIGWLSLVKTLLLVAKWVLCTTECSWTSPVRKDHGRGNLQGYCYLDNETSSLEILLVWSLSHSSGWSVSTPCFLVSSGVPL